MGQDIKLLAYNTLIRRNESWLKEEEEKLEAILLLDACIEIQKEIKKESNVDLGIIMPEKKENVNVVKSRIGVFKRKLEELKDSKDRYLGRKDT